MQVEVLCVGKLKESYLKDACNEYLKRLSRFCKINIVEFKDEAVSEHASDAIIQQAIQKEGERILSKIQERDYVVSLCVEGIMLSSEELSGRVSKIEQIASGRLVLIIGGSYGLSDAVKARSDMKLSFSKMTFPHQLMRVIMLEQLYRAYKIKANESYHK